MHISLQGKINEVAKKFPDKIAIECGSSKISYLELENVSNSIAGFLCGIKSENKNILMLMEKSEYLVEYILATIKAGFVFVPLDPKFPVSRLSIMAEISDCEWIVTQAKWLNKANELASALNKNLSVILINENTKEDIKFENLSISVINNCYTDSVEATDKILNKNCYIYFTSGSTGKPKGVWGRHKSLKHFVEWEIEEFSIDSSFKFSQLTSPSFDPFLRDILVPLCSGGTLCIPEEDEIILNPQRLVKWIDDNQINLIHMVPSLLKQLIEVIEDSNCLNSLKYILLAGELLRGNDIKKFIQVFGSRIQLVNLYGPTETTLAKFFYRVNEDDVDRAIIPVGKPIKNTNALILNNEMLKCRNGSVGEIYIRTPFISSGYYKEPNMTKEVFLVNPFSDNSQDIIYKTGDLGRILPDGNMEVIGRKDNQVKIRGFRIEIGEIENRLLNHKAIKEAVIIAKEDNIGSKYLCAYIVSDIMLTISELRDYLAQDLPEYMLPSYFIQLDKLPLTLNGKVDRKALYNSTLTEYGISMTVGTEYEAPRNEIEEALVSIWREVLGVEKIGINDNFFELGGHSLKAISVGAKIHKVLNVEVSLKEIFTNPTIKGISEYIKDKNESIYLSIEPVEEKEYYEMSSSQKRMYILNQIDNESISYNITKALIIEDELNLQKLTEVFEDLIDRHEALRTSFELIEEDLVQKVHKKVDFTVEYSEVEKEEQVEEKVKNFIRGFNLTKAPLLRIGLIKVNSNKHILICDMHHIIADGVSMGILIKEFCMLYQGIELPKLRIQYKDYAEWLNKPYYIERLDKQEKYWIDTFKNGFTSLNMPLDYDTKNWQVFKGDAVYFKIKNKIVKQLQELAKHENTTLNTLLLALYSILLSKYCEQKDIIIGSTVANRNYADLENMVGIFINFLPIRSNVNRNTKVIEYIQSYKTLLQEVYNNQEYPFDEIVKNCTSTIRNSRNPIFDTMLIYHNEKDTNEDFRINNLHISPYKLEKKTSTLDFKFDIALSSKNEFECLIEYNSSLYEDASMLDLAKHFELLIVKALSDLESNITDIEIFSEEEKQNIEIKRKLNNNDNTAINVVISSTFTADPLEEQLSWWCEKFGEAVKVSFASYNQVFQELIDPESITSKNTGINLIMIRFEDWIRDIKCSDKEKCNLIKSNYEKLIDILKNKEKNSQYIIGIFTVANHLGLSVEVTDYIKELNNKYRDAVKNMNDVSLLDFTDIAEVYNIAEIFNPITDKVGHIPFSDEYYAVIGTEIARKIHAIKHNPFKVIAVDCDNTLWKGVVGEDGALGIVIEEPYMEMQKLLIQKYNEGMLIVLSSKNNEADVWEIFNKNPQMLLKREHITSWKINWESKYIGLRALAQELNLGIDSFIFIDDSAKECYEMMANNPQVLTLQLPEEPKQIPMFLKHVWAFDKEKFTEEDKKRTRLYQVERQRQEVQRESIKLEDFLKELNLKVYINEIEEDEIPRVAQLTQRTNQFNLSTIRRTEADIEYIMKNPHMKCWTIQVEDHFGEYGLTGVVIIKLEDTAFLDTFLLSCRVLGRKVEATVLSVLCNYCKGKGISKIEADFYPTKKNSPFEEFLDLSKWQLVSELEKCKRYQILVGDIDASIDYIECHFCEERPRKQDEICISEVGATIETQAVQREQHFLVEPTWQVNINNEEELLHKNYLMQLKYCTGKKLLEISKNAHKYKNNNQVYETPRNSIEEKLAAIWREVLRVDRIGINDNFFELGGHSLKATSLISKIHKVLNVEVSLKEIFANPTIKGISEYIKDSEESIYSSIESVEEKEYYEMSSAQKRIYTLQQLEPNSTSYNMPGVLELEGNLDTERLKEAFKKLIQRHEALRTSFEVLEEGLIQKVHKEIKFDIEEHKSEEDKGIEEIVRGFIRTFDLSKAPLLRVGIIKIQPNKHILMYDMHHIISDGTSMGILVKEFSKAYAGEELTPLRIQYKDFSEWQNEMSKSEKIKTQEEYWLKQFEGEIPVLNLPADYQRPAVQSFEGDSIQFKIDKVLTNKLRQTAKATGSTMYMVLLSTFNILLSKYSRQEDIVIGSPIAGRPHAELGNIIGMFVNTLAMRNYPSGEKTFKEFLREVKENALGAYENQNYQFEELVEKLNIERDFSRNPLFDIMFILQNMDMREIAVEGIKIKPHNLENRISKFDMTVDAVEIGNSISINIQYCTKLFNTTTIERMYKHLENIIQAVTENIDTKLSEVDMLTEEERQQILIDFNNTKTDYPKDKTIHQLFEEQVERNPDSIALMYEDRSLTYRELNEKANQLARVLRGKGVVSDRIVGIMIERSLEMIVGIIGILKAGCAYLPIDPEYPKDRIEYMLQDSETSILLTQSRIKDKVEFSGEIVELEDEMLYKGNTSNIENIRKPQDTAYVIYTSGSTGKPKGVMIEDHSVVNFITGMTENIEFTSEKTILAITSISFDIFGLETLLPLTKGLKIVIADESSQKDINKLSEIIHSQKVDIIQSTPSRMRLLAENSDNKILYNLKEMIIGGEPLPQSLLEKLRSNTKANIYNVYGPTETTIWSTVRKLSERQIDIGKPIANTKVYIVDKHSNIVPVGVAGELCIAGEGLARGYLNRPELTSEKFIDNPFEQGTRMYRTGDLVRWLPDGNIEFLGRIDHQVKIRGYRIELGEIENKLLSYETVKETVVTARDDTDGNKYLCAYITGDEDIKVSELREYLSNSLPDYMIPSYFIQLDKLPLTQNGKLDRKALPKPDGKISTGTEYEAPRSSAEEKLVEIWREVLGVEKIGINDNFFGLGGHSLKATSLASKIHKIMNVEVPLKEIFTNPTIKGISEYIKDSEESIYSSIEPVEEKKYYEMSSSQKRMYILNQIDNESISYNITKALIIEDELNLQKLTEVFEDIIDRHEALRTSFELIEEDLVQKVHKKVDFTVEYSEVEKEEQVEVEEKVKNFIRGFNLTKAPLLRIGLIKVNSNKHILICDMHHIIADGVSMGILIKEFCMLYQGIELPKLRIQYKDYAEWLNKPYYIERLDKQEKYWIDTFKNGFTSLNMPLDYDTKNWQVFKGDAVYFKIKNKIVKQLQELAKHENTTLNTLLLALYSILLSKYCGQKEIIIGSTVENRNYADLENMVGIFINFLPIRSNVNSNTNVIEYIQSYKTLLQEVYNNQEYPFDEIVKNCISTIRNSRNPIFDTMLIYHNEIDSNEGFKIDNLHISPYKLEKKTSTLDFKLDIALSSKNEFECSIEYNSSIYEAASMLDLAKHFELLIVKALTDLESNITDIEIFSEEEKQNIEIKRKLNNNDNTAINVVISSTFTADPLEEQLSWWCEKFGEAVKVSFASYNQVFQELIDPESITSKNTGINLIMIRFEDWIRDIKCSDKEKCNLIKSNYEKLIDILKNKEKNSQYIIGIFTVANHLGLSVEVTDYIKELNNKYRDAVKNMNDVSLLDFTDIAKVYNIAEIFNPITDKVGHIPFSDEYYAVIGTEIARKIHAIKHNPFKVIAVDCDNTLWKGVVGEDGALGIVIEEPYMEMQKLLIQKYNEGMLIVLSSKNNEADVWEIFNKNPQMLLKREHITSWKINWESKYIGLRALAQELNLGIDSFIFIDDSAKECYEMMANNPQVLTLQLPEEPKQIPMFLKHVWAFDKEKFTEEDKKRTRLYQVERQRQEVQRESIKLEDFLKELNLKVYINEIEEDEIPRVEQLTQRTNQFNLSTIRRTEADIEYIMKNPHMKCWTIQVEDRFGEYGLTGVVIIKLEDTAFLDTFLLSCRVLGRKVEATVLSVLCNYCKGKGISKIEADFYLTKKNSPFEEFLDLSKWQLVSELEKCKRYQILVGDIDASIDYIECHFCEERPRKQDEICISEVGATIETQAVQREQHFLVEPTWQVNINNEEELLHKNYLMQLKYCTGKKLLEISKNAHKYKNNNQVYETPRNSIEEKLAAIWREVLRVDRIGINDNFFELGGHSLKATSLISKIHKVLNVEVSLKEIFANPTIKGISEYIKDSEESIYSSIESVEEKEYYEMSSAQKRIYTLQQLEPNSTSYNMPGVLELEGNLDTERLKEAFKKLIQRHEALRTSFEVLEEGLIQKVHKEIKFDIEEHKSEEDKGIEEIVRGFIRTFDLSKAPLLRVGIIKIQPNKHILMYDMHHIISDGTSMGILVKEFSKAYAGEELTPLRIQYKDFSEWQNEMSKSEKIKTQEEYWLKQFEGEIPVLNLPADYQRPAVQSFEGDSIQFKIDKVLTNKLRQTAKATGSTMYMVLLSTFNILLSKHSRQEDIVIGSPIAGRPHAELGNIIGMFVNTLAMRNYPSGEKTFKEFLREVKENALGAYENQNYQFEELVEKLNIERDFSRNPLFDIMFILQNMDMREIAVEGIKIKPHNLENRISKFDMTVDAVEIGNSISINIQYCTKLFNTTTIERMYKHLENIIQAVTENIDTKLSEVDMLTEEERQQILIDFNNTKTDYPKDKTIHQLFEEQVERTPDNIAVVFEDKQLTYREINERANQLARVLRDKGVVPDSIVGIMIERSFEMIVGIMGILKAGGAYLPIDSEYPKDRIEYILKDSKCSMLLTQKKLVTKIPLYVQSLTLEDESLYTGDSSCLEAGSKPHNLAYIIYTSGSTGKPKGVMLEHSGVVNTLYALKNKYPIQQNDAYLLKTTYTFDVSVSELFGWFMGAGRLVILKPDGEKEPMEILRAVRKYRVTHMNFVPSMLRVFVQTLEGTTEKPETLKYIFSAGEALSLELAESFRHIVPNIRLENLYGPTEATIYATRYSLSEQKDGMRITIGKPIENTKAYIVDTKGRTQPIGVVGELCLGGAGLARGYLNRPELTAEKFVDNPFELGTRMYRTGDLVRWLPDGNIEFLGRIDHQVKIRGYRIELGEIENKLLSHEAVKETVIISRDDNDGNKYLCAYITGDEDIKVSELREYLSNSLPDYMIPSYFIQLEKLPLTPNGKVDRKALPKPEGSILTGVEYEAPRNITEEKLVNIWREVLGIDGIGINDSFFELGGHSLKATSLAAKIHKVLNVEIPLREIFEAPTIKGISEYIKDREESIYSSIEPVKEKEYYEMSSAQKRIYTLQQLEPNSTSYNIPGVVELNGELDTEQLKEAFNKLIQRHEALRTSFEVLEEGLIQKVHSKVKFNIEEYMAEEDKGIQEIVKGFIRAFDLSKAPLLRVGLVRVNPNKHILMYDMHHIISDGVSMGILIEEFTQAYAGEELTPLRIQYKDFSEWQNKMFKYEKIKAQEEYWLKQFEGEIPVLNLPIDYQRPALQSFEGASEKFEIDKELTKKLRQIARTTGSTMYMVLLSTFNILLSKYSGQEDIVIGSPIAGRPHADMEIIIGMFVNTLAMRNYPSGEKTFNEFLREVKENALEGYDNQDYQLEELVEKLNVSRDFSRNPVFDVMLVLQNMNMGEAVVKGLKISPHKSENRVSKFDITMTAVELENNICIGIQYCTKLFSKATIEKMYKHLENIIQSVTENIDIKLSEVEIMTKEERQQILIDFNNTIADYPKDKTIHLLFEEQVARTPDNIAVIYEDDNLTYRELNERANQLARLLRGKGIVSDSIVAIMLERSLEMSIGILAILKAGGAYLPISPDYPKDRIKYMLEDSQVGVLLTQKRFMDKFEFKCMINLEDESIYKGVNTNLEYISTPRHLAYVIYTSGSTGKPKGVMIEHSSAINRINWMQKKYPLNSTDVILQKTTFTFDVSVWELFWWFFAGARVCFLIPGGEKDPEAIIDAIGKNKATTMHFVPSMLNIFLGFIDGNIETERLSSLRQVFVSGEALNLHQVEDFNRILWSTNGTKLINLYGPTEAAVDVSYFDCSTGQSLEVIPIGKPIDNIELYVMDKYNNLMPVGVPGELCIAGVGLARGYINRLELTAEKFVDNPFEFGTRMYRTGDLARWLRDGNIEFLGRIDHQVKIRGYRIELGEIENKLLSHDAVKETVVIARDDNSGNKYLCAYVVGDKEFTVTELRVHLSKDIPDYMIPSYFIQLDKLPLTSNGKVNTKALPEPDGSISTGAEYEVPRNSIEEKLVEIWREVLGVESIGINDNFFELGGHSLKATSLVAKIHKVLNVEVPLKEVFTNPTIKGISEYIKNSEESIYSSIEPAEEKDYYEMSSSQKRMYIINQMHKESTSYNMTRSLIIEDELNLQKFTEVFTTLVDRHEALRTSFELTEEGFVYKVHKKVNFAVEYSEIEEEQADEKVKSFIRAFDLSKAPILRVGLVKVQSNKYILVYDMHHIISDGVSMAILIREFCMLYQGIELPKLRIQYKDYTEWLREPYFTKRLEKQEKYWMETFKNEITPLNMPLDYDKENWQVFVGDTIHFKIKNDIVKQLQELAIHENTTLNTILLALYNILLSKYCKQNDIIVGSTVANRNHAELENMVGIFINFLPIRSNVNPNAKVIEYFQSYKMLLSEVYDNQDYPFDEIVEKCANTMSNSRNPIFDTMLIFHNEVDMNEDLKIDNLHISPYKLDWKSATLDFKLDIALNHNNEFECLIEYNSSLYEAASMFDLAKHYELLIVKSLANIESNITDIEIFSEEEKQNIEMKRKSNNNDNTATNVVISSTFTADPLEEHLSWWCEKFGEAVKVSFASYNQVFQELIDPESITSKNTGINLILVRFEDWIRDIKYSDKEKCNLIKSNYEKLIDILKQKEKNSQYIIGIFPIATHLGLSFEVADYIKELNNEYRVAVKNMNDVVLLDLTDIAELYNITEVFNSMSDEAGHIPFSDEYYAAIGTVIARKICAAKPNPFKVIAVDCDNTLWKGVVGEDGALGVAVEEPYMEMQKLLIQKYNEGMLIVLISKNNEADVWEVFDKNPQMILKREHITSWKINWESKYIGLRALAQELNLGIDSFIFIDDSAKECYEMMMNNPQVLTLQLPEEPKQIPMFLKHVWAFDKEKFTEEDKSRTKLYQVERQRQEVQKESSTLQDFLKELNLKIYINEVEEAEIPRISQLVQRTNQFNLSTIRRTEADIEYIMKNPQMKCWTIQVEDRFGEYGLTGVVIMEEKEDTAFLDTFLLSCRVLGRKVEAAMLAELCKYCKGKGISKIEADFYPTKKNSPFEEFLNLSKWQLVSKSEKCKIYEILVGDIDASIDYIECHFCEERPKKQDEIFVSEVAATVETKAIEKEYNSVEPTWQINIHNEEELLHKNYLLQLRYCTGKKLLKVPRDRQKYRDNNQVYEAPRNITEEKLAGIYKVILRIDKVGINDDFFELGGNSIKLINLILKINKELRIDIYPQKIVESPTIKGISEYILEGRFTKKLYLLNEKKEKKLFAFPPIAGYGIYYTDLAKLIETHSLYVFDFIAAKDRVEQYIKQIMEVQKEGPYTLLGYSAGGNLAYEVALQMTKNGHEVTDIIIIDTDLGNDTFKNMKEEQIDIMKIVEQGVKDMAARKKYDELNQTLDIEYFRSTVERSINIYINYLRNFNISEDKLKSNIHLILSDGLTDDNQEHIKKTWKNAIAGRLIIFNGSGNHMNMISGGDLKYNAELLNGILKAL